MVATPVAGKPDVTSGDEVPPCRVRDDSGIARAIDHTLEHTVVARRRAAAASRRPADAFSTDAFSTEAWAMHDRNLCLTTPGRE